MTDIGEYLPVARAMLAKEGNTDEESIDKCISMLKLVYNDLTEEDFDENLYDKWYDEEMSRINCSGLDWIRSRYSIDNQVTLEDNPDYTCDIPVEFLP